jgi:hypothetical protein
MATCELQLILINDPNQRAGHVHVRLQICDLLVLHCAIPCYCTPISMLAMLLNLYAELIQIRDDKYLRHQQKYLGTLINYNWNLGPRRVRLNMSISKING